MTERQGLVAILDALGAAQYDNHEISRFLTSRQRVLAILEAKAHAKEVRGEMEPSSVTTFTFNDTVLLVHTTQGVPIIRDVKNFCLLLRKFAVDSLAHGIFFRGSLSIGKFYVDANTNTVMGSAVTDAAAWYDSAEWVGISATPQATMLIQSLLDETESELDRLLVDYPVPLRDGPALRLRAVNWPKGFVVQGVTPVAPGGSPRAKCLSLLAAHGVPKGSEAKHFNTVAFFDHCIGVWEKGRKIKKSPHPGRTRK